MKAVMYGGGNIGRGFIGYLMSASGYRVSFIDVVDSVIESIGTCKYFTIVTTKKEEIGEYIMNTIHHGFTELHGLGGFTGEDRYVLLTVCKRIEGTRLRKFCKEVDPHAFLIVSNTSEIIGKGFRAV